MSKIVSSENTHLLSYKQLNVKMHMQLAAMSSWSVAQCVHHGSSTIINKLIQLHLQQTTFWNTVFFMCNLHSTDLLCLDIENILCFYVVIWLNISSLTTVTVMFIKHVSCRSKWRNSGWTVRLCRWFLRVSWHLVVEKQMLKGTNYQF